MAFKRSTVRSRSAPPLHLLYISSPDRRRLQSRPRLMSISTGSRLGPYEILGPLGAGGMGEVYRARDERLKRDVAIKVLPASYSQDADRLRRFEQEAQAAGALNHPNITAVYDLGAHDGAPYIVTELLEGETLRARLAGGAFAVRKAIEYSCRSRRAWPRRTRRESSTVT